MTLVARSHWRTAAWTIAAVGALVLILPIAGLGLFVWGVGDPCGYEVKAQALSPDGGKKAAVVEVNCGATTAFASWAVLAPAERPFDFKKDRVATIDGRAMRVAWEGSKLIVFWRAERPPNRQDSVAAEVEYRPL